MSMILERVRKMASPYAVPKAKQDLGPWNGEISSGRPEFVRLNIEQPPPAC